MTRLVICIALAAALLPAVSIAQMPGDIPDLDKSQRPKPDAPEDPQLQPGAVPLLSEEDFQAAHQMPAEKPVHHAGAMIDVLGGEASAYLSLPSKLVPPVPGVILIHESWGLNDNMKYWADRLASAGYAALAVDLYGGKVTDDPDTASAYSRGVEEKRAMVLLQAAQQVFAKDPRIRSERVGCIGWSTGGTWALRDAMASPNLGAVVIYYGAPDTNAQDLKSIRAPVLAIYGNRDESIPPKTVYRFDEALRSAGVRAEVVSLDAGKGFANPTSRFYNRDAAAAAWAKVEPFLSKNLKKKA